MKNKKKLKSLKENNSFNKNHDKVADLLFHENDFFNPEDLAQVKYEMIRKVKKNECSVKKTTELFGFSRVTFYKILDIINNEGLQGLIPKKRGPQAGHKLTPQIEQYIEDLISGDSKFSTTEITDKIQNKFSVELHKRTIERCLSKIKKNKMKTK